jgi:hypothetical protein
MISATSTSLSEQIVERLQPAAMVKLLDTHMREPSRHASSRASSDQTRK